MRDEDLNECHVQNVRDEGEWNSNTEDEWVNELVSEGMGGGWVCGRVVGGIEVKSAHDNQTFFSTGAKRQKLAQIGKLVQIFFSFSMIWLFLGLSKKKRSKKSYRERFTSTI